MCGMSVLLATFFVIYLSFLCQKGLAQSIQCKENEEYQECASGCPLTCKNYKEPFFCTEHCKKGCFCRPGYVLGPGNKCVRPTDCPIGPCNSTEVPSTCVNPCNNCLQKGKCFFEYCIKGCDCKPGHFRNSSGVCVQAENCESESTLCPVNEHYVQCVNPCNDCWSKGHCEADVMKYCQPGCDCNPGYYRDDYGSCVSEDQCLHHDFGCGPNEYFTDCVVECNDCQSKGHCHHYECQYGCDCKRGFFRNHNHICVPESQCSTPKCPLYEEYSECGTSCPATCDSIGKTISCTLQCVKGCFCSRGYIRGPNGRCIRPDECPRVCGVYEEYRECGTACPRHCSNSTSPTAFCPNICVRGCFCKVGFVKGPNGTCIPESSCPPVCGEYEEYKECGSSCPATCANRAHMGDCSLPCTKGCFCVPGYIKGPTGKCILPENCPPVCGRNEEFSDCGPACPANCTNRNPRCNTVCVRGCFCKPGFIRDPNGLCVLPSDCPLLCDENEVYMACGPRCEPECLAIHRSAALCPACDRGCFCKPGYVRGPDRKCILPTSCPAACDENEEFSNCGSPCQANCSNPNPSCRKICTKGCFCREGYIRNSNYVCVLPTECPIECGEYEEFSECATSCPPTCTDRNPICTPNCVRGCVCQSGYIRDENNKCISISECPPVRCPENEHHLLYGTSCQVTCDNIGLSIPCEMRVVAGCFCDSGFVRGPSQTCIRRELCPNRFEGRNKASEEIESITSSLNLIAEQSQQTSKMGLTKALENLASTQESITPGKDTVAKNIKTTKKPSGKQTKAMDQEISKIATVKPLVKPTMVLDQEGSQTDKPKVPPTKAITNKQLNKSTVNQGVSQTKVTEKPSDKQMTTVESKVIPRKAAGTPSEKSTINQEESPTNEPSDKQTKSKESTVSLTTVTNKLSEKPEQSDQNKINAAETESSTSPMKTESTSSSAFPTKSDMNKTTV